MEAIRAYPLNGQWYYVIKIDERDTVCEVPEHLVGLFLHSPDLLDACRFALKMIEKFQPYDPAVSNCLRWAITKASDNAPPKFAYQQTVRLVRAVVRLTGAPEDVFDLCLMRGEEPYLAGIIAMSEAMEGQRLCREVLLEDYAITKRVPRGG